MPNNEPTSYDNFPGIDPTLSPREVLAQFKNELQEFPATIKGFAQLLLEQYPQTDPSSTHDKWLRTISKAADFMDILIGDIQDYLDSSIDPTLPPEEALAQFKNELRKYPAMIKGHAYILLEYYPQTDPNSKHDGWLRTISKAGDEIETLIRFVHDYLENRANLPK